MTRLDSTRAVTVLAEVDPEFTALTRSLYGGDLTPDKVWADVFAKISPDPSDVHNPMAIAPPRRRHNRATKAAAITATTIGTALGVKELATEGPKAVRAVNGVRAFRTRGGWLAATPAGARLPRVPRPGPAARTAGTLAMFGGDILATHQLRHQDDTAATVGVGKSVVGDLAEGVVRQTRQVVNRLVPVGTGRHRAASAAGGAFTAGKHRAAATGQSFLGGVKNIPAAPGSTGRAHDLGYAAGQRFGQMTATPGRKAATYGGAAAVGLLGMHHHNKTQQAAQQPSYFPGPAPFYYSKRSERDVDVEWAGEFSKLDTDKQLAFGWASISKMDGMPVLDRQGDVILPEDIEDAVYAYVEKSRVGGSMHRRTLGKTGLFDGPADAPHKVADLVESMLFTDEKIEKMGLPDSFPRAWWVGFHYHDPDAWDDVKSGRHSGFSIHGKGYRTPIDLDELMYGAVH